jgi:hypothetical protein
MKSRTAIIFLSLLPLLCNGQGVIGSWTDYLSYYTSLRLAAGDEKIFSSTGKSLLIRDLQYNVTEKMTRANGLTETEISSLGWSDDEECLVIAYSNTNIDILKNREIRNIPDIERKYIAGLKEINRIKTNGKYAYLACSFGIVVLDLKRYVIADTWRPGSESNSNQVYDIAFLNGEIYAATSTGVFHASLTTTGLSYFGNWDILTGLPSPSAVCNNISSFGNYLYLSNHSELSGADILYKITPGQTGTVFFSEENMTIKSIETGTSGILVTTGNSVALFSESGQKIENVTSYSWGIPNPAHALIYKGSAWIADISVGLVATSDYSTFNNLTLPGPYTSNVADIFIKDNKVFVTGGTVTSSWGSVYRPLQVFTLSGDSWYNSILYGTPDRDAMRVVSDPKNNNHYFVSSWGNGIYEFLNGEMINNYNQDNSPLLSMIPGSPYSRICGLAYDNKNNLWMTQSGVAGNLKMLNSDGTWKSTNVSLNVPVVGDLLIDSNGFLWAVLPRGNGLLVYDPADTPDNIDDDNYLTLQVEDGEGNVLNDIYSIAEDLDGNIWVGTDKGPAVYYSPEKVFVKDLKATRIKVPRNDGSGLADFLLSTETITSIAIDGANRKWFGTMSSGAYLVSEDGMKQLQKFTMTDSPILSDQIVKICVDEENGEVWFGTASGIISFRGDATAGETNYSGLYTFPNPVREDFGGVVTITGLMENSTVKITDISGNLVYEAISTGGQVTWDLLNYKGNRVSTGVYLVFCSNRDGTVSAVTKMLIIR